MAKFSNFSMSQLNHAAGIFADMSVDGPAIGTLVAIVDRAKNLPNRKSMGKQNPYCAARLGKEAKKTETDIRGGQTPRWDSELRFTVHESPDYFRLKVSVFNDDKKTELIGETWIDLGSLIIPGGGQSDSWHPLQSKGKYAGEVRIEMTYYDTRPEDEAVIEKRTGHTVERVHARPSGSTKSSSSLPTPTPVAGSSTLSGPRQLKEVKRRPLPTDPASSMPMRPPPPEKVPSAPAQAPAQPPVRSMQYEPAQLAPVHPSVDYAQRPRSHSGIPEHQFDAPPQRPVRGYDAPADFPRELHHPAPVHPPAPVTKRYTQDPHYNYREPTVEDYDPRPPQPRMQVEDARQVDYRSSRQDLSLSRQDYAPVAADTASRGYYETGARQNGQNNYPFASSEQIRPIPEPAPAQYGQIAKYSPRASGNLQEYPPAEYGHHQQELERHYRPHSSSIVSNSSRMRQPVGHDMHTEYATMQPSVEDEDEDGPPPPPPVHRSGLVQSSQPMVPAPAPVPSYQAYSPQYAPSPRASHDLNVSQSSYYEADPGTLPNHQHTSGPAMPPSLVAGYDPVIAEDESDRAIQERRASRGRSVLFEDDVIAPQVRDPSPVPPYPVGRGRSPSPLDGNRGSMVIRRKPSANPDTQIVPLRKSVSPQPLQRKSVSPQPFQRKSVSPRPPPVGDRGMSSIPFGPDSYDAFNPNASRSSLVRDLPPSYNTPAEAASAAMRSQTDGGPIIGDDGREIDPSDHLPSDTWAPEPERKTKKPGVVVRFKNSPSKDSSLSSQTSSSRGAPARVTFKPSIIDRESYAGDRDRWSRPQSSYSGRGPSPSPRGDYTGRGREEYSYGNGPVYSTHSPRSSRRGSTSPLPSPRSHSPSSLYAPSSPGAGPPIPAKIPVTHSMNQSYPVMAPNNSAMDALSRELTTIDIGCNPQRAVRKYVPKTISTGYAS